MALLAIAGPVVLPDGALAAPTDTVTGKVFVDKDVDGVLDAGESGYQGLTVRLYDADGTLVNSTTTAADGTWSTTIGAAVSQDVRVEFDTPAGYQSSFAGANNGTSIQFVTAPASNVQYAIQIPSMYCDNNASAALSLAAVCIRPGSSSGTAASASSISSMSWTARSPGKTTNFGQTGAIWGMASDRSLGTIWTSAVVRAHSGLGPKGLGGLYVTLPGSTAGVIASFDLAAAPYNLSFAATPSDFTDAARGIVDSSLMSIDRAGYEGVGMVGIGDIDISGDYQYLYVTNLHTRTIHRFALTGTQLAPTLGAMTTYSLPGSVCATARPWALNATATAGHLLVGVVCTNEGSAFSATGGAGAGQILDLDVAANSWTTTTAVDFGYLHGNERCKASNDPVNRCNSVQWHAWTNDFATIRSATAGGSPTLYREALSGTDDGFWYSQPMIVDIETLEDGSLVLGVSDRFNYQLGSTNLAPDETNAVTPTKNFATSRISGDLLLLCRTASGYAQENIAPNDGGCTNASGTVRQSATRTSTHAGLASETGHREFFDDNLGGASDGAHQEITIGGLAVYPATGSQLIAVSSMDANNVLYTNGVRWYNQSDGSMNGSGATVTSGASDSFGKSVSMGDLELVCDAAPVQIGDRLWYDMDRDGIQDPGEGPAVGVVVTLYNLQGTKVGTAVTNADGEYYFSSTVSESANGTGDNVGGGLAKYTGYQIRITDTNNYMSGPLDYHVWEWTDSNQPAANTSMDDAIDSDATLVPIAGAWTWARYDVAPLGSGEVNHTFDFGLAPKPASIGNRVWYETPNSWGDWGSQNDLDGSGDPPEDPVVGAWVTLTDLDGNPVVDVNGNLVQPQQTDADGNYLFQDLQPGYAYKVSITYPDGYGPAPLANPDWYYSDMDTSAWSATTDVLSPGQFDDTLDFGIVAAVDVGNFVWIDTDGDGIQDQSESGIAGVTLTITDTKGNPVLDTAGLPVGPATTDANGHYEFRGLPSGTYDVTITYPAGYGPTRIEQGNDAAADSSARVAVSTELVAGDPTRSHDPTLDFGIVTIAIAPVAVGNYVWIDTDHDGIQDQSESGIAGVTLTLTDMDDRPVVDQWGDPVGPITTDDTGQYLFDGLPPGQYKVWITYPTGYGQTLEHVGSNTSVDSSTWVATSRVLPAGEADLTLDFGVVAGVTPPPAPTTTSTTSTSTSTTTSSTTTSSTSTTSTTLSPSSSTTSTTTSSTTTSSTSTSTSTTSTTRPSSTSSSSTSTTRPNSSTSTSSTTSSTSTTSTSSTTTSSIPGQDPGSVVIGNYVWSDLDSDGVQEPGEPGIDGAVLSVTDEFGAPVTDIHGNPVDPQITGPDGAFMFMDLLPGKYLVHIVYPAGTGPTRPGQGGSADDSAALIATSLDLAAGEYDLTLDFGVVPMEELPVAIGNYVWLDADLDGIQDSSETPIPGVTLTCTNPDGTPVTDIWGRPVGPLITDDTGFYLFTGLRPGRYRVVITYPEGYAPTTPDMGDDRGRDSSLSEALSVVLAPGEVDLTLDFGVVALDPIPGDGGDAGGGSALPQTGSSIGPFVLWSVALLGGGSALVALQRRRTGGRGDGPVPS